MQEFAFSYMLNKTKVSIDDKTLIAKIGPIMKKEISLESIQHFYIKDYKDYKELIIRYTKSNGKIANQKLLHAYGEQGAVDLANALAERFPEKDLRGADPKEAMKLLKATNSQKLGFYLAFLIVFLLVTGFFLPTLIHYFDFGHQIATVEDIMEGKKLSSRNLTISGLVLNAGMWEENTTTKNGSTSKSENNYFPLVSDSWVEGDPVYVLLKTGYMSQDDVDIFVFETESFNGIIRDVFWEGIDDEQIDFLTNEYSLNFSKDAKLFEVTNEKSDKIMFFVYIGILGIFVIIFIVMGIKQRKMSK
ncbi:MAG: hypothetical protein ABIJ97_03520 [Bacteroidota bacterium]